LKRLATSLLILTSLWLVIGTVPVAIAQNTLEKERLLKAVFIYNFAKFTRWPENALGTEDESLNLCVVGRDELAISLEQLGGKMIKRRSIAVDLLHGSKIPSRCHLLYIATSERGRYKKIIKALKGSAILTISELSGFSRSGGVVELYREKEKLRFIINLDAARGAGLIISSRLLGLATVLSNEDEP